MPGIIQHAKGIGPGRLERFMELVDRRLHLRQSEIMSHRDRACAGRVAEPPGGERGGNAVAIFARRRQPVKMLIGPIADHQRQPRLARLYRLRKHTEQNGRTKQQCQDTRKQPMQHFDRVETLAPSQDSIGSIMRRQGASPRGTALSVCIAKV